MSAPISARLRVLLHCSECRSFSLLCPRCGERWSLAIPPDIALPVRDKVVCDCGVPIRVNVVGVDPFGDAANRLERAMGLPDAERPDG